MNLSMFFLTVKRLLLCIKNKRIVSLLCKTHKELRAVAGTGTQLLVLRSRLRTFINVKGDVEWAKRF